MLTHSVLKHSISARRASQFGQETSSLDLYIHYSWKKLDTKYSAQRSNLGLEQILMDVHCTSHSDLGAGHWAHCMPGVFPVYVQCIRRPTDGGTPRAQLV